MGKTVHHSLILLHSVPEMDKNLKRRTRYSKLKHGKKKTNTRRKLIKQCYELIRCDDYKNLVMNIDHQKETKPIKFHKRYCKGRTILHQAVKYGAKHCLIQLIPLCKGKEFDTFDEHGYLPIHVAAVYVEKQRNDKKKIEAWQKVLVPVISSMIKFKSDDKLYWLHLKVKDKDITVHDILETFFEEHPLLLQAFSSVKRKHPVEFTSSSSSDISDSTDSSSDTDEGEDSDYWRRRLADELGADVMDGDSSYRFHGYRDDEADAETYDQWAARLRREHGERKRRRDPRPPRARKQVPEGRPRERLGPDKPQEEEVFAWAEQRRRLLVSTEKRRYERTCAKLFHSTAASTSEELSVSDLPWAADTFPTMLTCDIPEPDQRRFLTKQQLLWHPDSFQRKCKLPLPACEARLKEVLDRVKAYSQSINLFISNMETKKT